MAAYPIITPLATVSGVPTHPLQTNSLLFLIFSFFKSHDLTGIKPTSKIFFTNIREIIERRSLRFLMRPKRVLLWEFIFSYLPPQERFRSAATSRAYYSAATALGRRDIALALRSFNAAVRPLIAAITPKIAHFSGFLISTEAREKTIPRALIDRMPHERGSCVSTSIFTKPGLYNPSTTIPAIMLIVRDSSPGFRTDTLFSHDRLNPKDYIGVCEEAVSALLFSDRGIFLIVNSLFDPNSCTLGEFIPYTTLTPSSRFSRVFFNTSLRDPANPFQEYATTLFRNLCFGLPAARPLIVNSHFAESSDTIINRHGTRIPTLKLRRALTEVALPPAAAAAAAAPPNGPRRCIVQ